MTRTYRRLSTPKHPSSEAGRRSFLQGIHKFCTISYTRHFLLYVNFPTVAASLRLLTSFILESCPISPTLPVGLWSWRWPPKCTSPLFPKSQQTSDSTDRSSDSTVPPVAWFGCKRQRLPTVPRISLAVILITHVARSFEVCCNKSLFNLSNLLRFIVLMVVVFSVQLICILHIYPCTIQARQPCMKLCVYWQ